MKSLKKVGALVLAFAMIASTMSAFACANDTFIAYDEIPDVNGEYGKLYMCPAEDTIIRNGSAKKAEWVHAFYEAEYPHRAIEVLVLDGYVTKFTRFDGEYADVNVKETPEFWEAKVPYFVYNRVYSDFTGAYKPTNVLKTNYVTAPVAKEWVNVGFDKYVKTSENTVVDYSHVYGLYDEKIDFEWNKLDDLAKEYWAKNIAGIDADGNFIFTSAFINGNAKDAYALFDHKTVESPIRGKDACIYDSETGVNNVSWLQLTGPDYANGGKMSFKPFEKLVKDGNSSWYDDTLVSDNKYTIEPGYLEDHINLVKNSKIDVDPDNKLGYEDRHATIEWKVAGYELVAPYRTYEVLYINGVPMDGSEVDVIGYEVKKEEVVEVFGDDEYENEIHIVEKATEYVDSEVVSDETDYVVTPFDVDATRTQLVQDNYKVIEDYRLENVAKIDTPQGPQYEVRFVKTSTQPGKSKLPYIWRYTGGVSQPKVEWKLAFAEAAYPYEIYEEKFVNGIATGVYRSTGEYANDVVKFSADWSQPRVLTVILEAEVDKQKLSQELEFTAYPYIIAGDRLNVIVSGDIYPGNYNTAASNYDNVVAEINQIVHTCKVIK